MSDGEKRQGKSHRGWGPGKAFEAAQSVWEAAGGRERLRSPGGQGSVRVFVGTLGSVDGPKVYLFLLSFVFKSLQRTEAPEPAWGRHRWVHAGTVGAIEDIRAKIEGWMAESCHVWPRIFTVVSQSLSCGTWGRGGGGGSPSPDAAHSRFHPLGSQQARDWVSPLTRNSPTQPATWPRWQSCLCAPRCPWWPSPWSCSMLCKPSVSRVRGGARVGGHWP